MPSIYGRIVKITPEKKLLVSVTEDTYEYLNDRSFEFGRRHFGLNQNLKDPVMAWENRLGEEGWSCKITLDQYDKQRIEKFEALLRKDVVIDYKLREYDFPVGDERIQGINIILTNIRKYTGKKPLFEEYKRLNDIDKIADAAAARAISATVGPISSLTAEEKEVDEVIAPLIAERFNLDAVAATTPLPLSPPPLIRQNAVATGMPVAVADAADANSNRRRRYQ